MSAATVQVPAMMMSAVLSAAASGWAPCTLPDGQRLRHWRSLVGRWGGAGEFKGISGRL